MCSFINETAIFILVLKEREREKRNRMESPEMNFKYKQGAKISKQMWDPGLIDRSERFLCKSHIML